MIRYNKAIAFLAIIFCLSACGTNQTAEEEVIIEDTWPNAVTYEIFVMSFYDSDGDGLGDIPGMTTKLDYLADLGVQGVWLMPIMPSPTYHKYHVTDFKDIDEQYGTMEDFKVFVDEAHKRNISVITDLVINHVDVSHPWFIESKKGPKITDASGNQVDNPYWDYFVWKTDEEIEELPEIESGEDTDNKVRWHEVEGLDGYKYYAYFTGEIPDINFDHEPVKKEIFEIGQWWLQEVGVDGFRLDAAKHIFDFEPDRNPGFWVEFRNSMKEAKPDVFLVGEVWDSREVVAPYLAGLPASFNFDLGDAIVNTVEQGWDTSLVKTYIDISNYYKDVSDEYVDATFIRNHDQNRVLNEFGYDNRKARMATSILLTLPGAPYLYYGEEIGMRGEKPDLRIREPFVWDFEGLDEGQTSWTEGEYSNWETVTPLSEQMKDEESMYSFYKEMIQLRNQSDVLKFGDITEVNDLPDEVVAFQRGYEGETLLVLHNISDQPINIDLQDEMRVVYTSTTIPQSDESISLKEYSTLILEKIP